MGLKQKEPIAHITFDFLKCARSANQNVLDAMSEIAASIFNTTGFFRTLKPLASSDARVKGKDVSLKHLRYAIEQQGTLRTNCIDCLDRTNVAQFCLGRICLRAQMEALNINVLDSEEYTLVWQELMKMYADHGNCMGNQYGGSGAMHSLALAKPTSSDVTMAKRMVLPRRVLMKNTSVYFCAAHLVRHHDVLRSVSWAEGQATYAKHGKDALLDVASDTYTSFALDAPIEEKNPRETTSSKHGISGRFFGLTRSKGTFTFQADKYEGDDESNSNTVKSSPASSPTRSAVKKLPIAHM